MTTTTEYYINQQLGKIDIFLCYTIFELVRIDEYWPMAEFFGPFHRRESSTQSCEIAVIQRNTGEIWGGSARWGDIPAVRAYAVPLPKDLRGIEFTTWASPRGGSPIHVKWCKGDPDVHHREKNGTEYVCILAEVKNCQECLP